MLVVTMLLRKAHGVWFSFFQPRSLLQPVLTLVSFAPSVLSLCTQSATRLLRCPLPRISVFFSVTLTEPKTVNVQQAGNNSF